MKKCKKCKQENETKDYKMSVPFKNDQNNGRPCPKYTSLCTISLCNECYSEILHKGLKVKGFGVMGYNEYTFYK